MSKKRTFDLVVCITAFLLNIATTAIAQPPVLNSVGQNTRHLTSTWTLPTTDVEALFIEAANSPNVGSDGYFWDENLMLYSGLDPHQTTFLGSYQLPPGWYYVHVAGVDYACDECPWTEFSNVLSVLIPEDPPQPPPAPTYTPLPPTPPTTTTGTTNAAKAPTMSEKEAKSHVKQVIKKMQHKSPKRLKSSCKQLSTLKYKCKVRWLHRSSTYKGTFLVWAELKNGRKQLYERFNGTSTKKKCKSKKKCNKRESWS